MMKWDIQDREHFFMIKMLSDSLNLIEDNDLNENIMTILSEKKKSIIFDIKNILEISKEDLLFIENYRKTFESLKLIFIESNVVCKKSLEKANILHYKTEDEAIDVLFDNVGDNIFDDINLDDFFDDDDEY